MVGCRPQVALLAWARQKTGRHQTLSSLSRRTEDAQQIQALKQLDAAAFGQAEHFERETLLRFVEQFREPAAATRRAALAPLYPEQP